MNLPINELQKFITVAGKIVPKKPTMQVLGYASIKDGYIHVTNCEIAARMPLTSGVDCIISYKILSDILKTKPQNLELTIEEDKAIFQFDGHRLNEVIKYNDFPNWPEPETSVNIGYWDRDLISALSLTTRFCSDNALKPGLTGVYVTQSDSNIEIVATNGHRLRVYNLKTDSQTKFTGIIPPDLINILQSLKTTGTAFQSITPQGITHLDIITDTIEFSARLIDEQFPDYKGVIPTEYGQSYSQFRGDVVFDRKAMIEALKTADKLQATPSDHRIKILPINGQIEVSADNPELQREFKSNIRNDINTLSVDDRQKAIGFNAQFLWEILELHDGDTIKWQVGSPISAQMFPGENYTDLLMPIRLE